MVGNTNMMDFLNIDINKLCYFIISCFNKIICLQHNTIMITCLCFSFHIILYYGSPPLYFSYVSPQHTKQDQNQETLEAVGDIGQWIKKVTKVKESKQWKKTSGGTCWVWSFYGFSSTHSSIMMRSIPPNTFLLCLSFVK